MQRKPKLILLIGAPSTGKTSVIDYLSAQGYSCFEEVSREIVQEARADGISHLFKEKPLLFSEKLLKKRLTQYHEAKTTASDFVFIDRGLPDITAYLDMVNTPYPKAFSDVNQKFQYDMVFWFPLWNAIYTADAERYEGFELSKRIESFLIKTYAALNYELIEVPKAPIQDRVFFMLSHLNTK